jgi:lipoprotein-releasing system permease protein
MNAIFFLLRRYLLPTQGNLLTFALWISVAGVALGIIQLMVVLSVMSGFQEFLRTHYSRISSELVVIPRHHSEQADRPLDQTLLSFKEIAAVSPFALGQAMLLKEGVAGVVLEGIDPKTAGTVTPLGQIWITPPLGALQESNPHWIWLGAQLAKKLGAHAGDSINLFLPGEKKLVPFVVTAITKFGIYDHDLRYARVDLKVLEQLLGSETGEPMFKTLLKPGAELEDVAKRIKAGLGARVSVRKWSEINQNLFRAVEHQKYLLFLILEIVIGLAAMNVINLLMMSSHYRRRDVAILRSMGMGFGSVFTFFVLQGAAVGSVGIVLGVGLGVGVCHLVERFQPSILSESIYNVTRLPISVQFKDVLLIGLGAFLLCVVFSVLPALRAALARPVRALRYE